MSRKDHSLLVIIILMFLVVSIVFGLQLKNTLHAQQSPNPSVSTEAKPAISVKQENLNPQLSPANNLGNNYNSGNEPHDSQPINNGHSSSSSNSGSSSHGGTSSGGSSSHGGSSSSH